MKLVDYTTDTALHPFAPSSYDVVLCKLCGEHTSWHSEDMNMYEHFSAAELACRCGCGLGEANMDPEFMADLEQLRTEVGFALPVTSAIRCPDHNVAVSTTGRNGPHTTGKAVDLAINRKQGWWVNNVAPGLGFTGLGWQQKGGSRFFHLDTLTEAEGHFPRPTIWSY